MSTGFSKDLCLMKFCRNTLTNHDSFIWCFCLL